MQISRHWRMNAQRYRMDGIRVPNTVPTQTPTAEAQHVNQPVQRQAIPAQRLTVSAAR